MQKYTIGDTAKITGLPAKTIRFYEEEGVISPALRGENGYRQYPGKSVEELKVLKYARDLELPLSEIKKLMRGCKDGDCKHSRQYIQDSINNYLSLLDGKIEQMEILQKKLTGLNKKIGSGDTDCDGGIFCCNILHQLIDEPKTKGGEKDEKSN